MFALTAAGHIHRLGGRKTEQNEATNEGAHLTCLVSLLDSNLISFRLSSPVLTHRRTGQPRRCL